MKFIKMKRIIILFILITVFRFSNASGQIHTDTLTIQEAVQIALKNNLNIQVARDEIKKNEYNADEYKAGLLPSVSGKAHYIYAPEDAYDPAVTNGGEYGLQVSADYTLYDGGHNHLAVDKANTGVTLSELNLEKVKSDLIFNVRSVYYEINNSEREVEYLKEALNSLNDYYKYLKESETGGNANHSDVLKTEVNLNNAKIDLSDSELYLETVRKELNRLLFLPADSGFKYISSAVIDTAMPQTEPPDISPEVKIAEMEAKVNSFDFKAAQAEKLPVISLNGDAGVLGVKPENYRNDLGYSASVDLSVPLFSWGKINARIQQAAVGYEQSKINTELVRKNLMIIQDSLLAEFNLARQKMEAYRDNIKTAEDNFYYSKALFMGGSGSTLEVLDAFRLLNDIKTNYNNSILSLQLTKAGLLKLYGR
jgi:outer membrane protein TolC